MPIQIINYFCGYPTLFIQRLFKEKCENKKHQ